jgi:hypothetical protein
VTGSKRPCQVVWQLAISSTCSHTLLMLCRRLTARNEKTPVSTGRDFREQVRAARAKVVISTHFNSKQQAFLDFVLAHYVSVGGRAVGPGEAHALVAAQIPQLHLRRLSRHSTMVRSIQSLGMLLGSQLSFPSSRLNEQRHIEISHLDARASKLSALQQINGPFLTDGIVFSR